MIITDILVHEFLMILPVNILKAFDNIDGIGNVHLIDCNRYIISIGIFDNIAWQHTKGL